MIRNIIFDIGNVLVKNKDLDFFRGKGFDEQTVIRVAGATCFSPVWTELDRGIWPLEKIIDGFVENCPESEREIRMSMENLSGYIEQFPYTKEWIAELHRDEFRVYCLSNLSDKILQDCARELDFLPLLDGYLLSYRENLVKPNHKIYERMLERFRLQANECIFIDDRKENVVAAISVGINGFVFTDLNVAKQNIQKMTKLNG